MKFLSFREKKVRLKIAHQDYTISEQFLFVHIAGRIRKMIFSPCYLPINSSNIALEANSLSTRDVK